MQFQESSPARTEKHFFYWSSSSLIAHPDAPGAWKSHKSVKEICSKLYLQALPVSIGEKQARLAYETYSYTMNTTDL